MWRELVWTLGDAWREGDWVGHLRAWVEVVLVKSVAVG